VVSTEYAIEKKFMSIPYILEVVASALNGNDYIVGYRCLNNLGKFIKVQKDRSTLLNNNNVIYKIFCKDCDALYGRLKEN